MSACEAHLARLGPPMNHLIEFRDPDTWFESLGTYAELRDKFGDLECNLLGILFWTWCIEACTSYLIHIVITIQERFCIILNKWTCMYLYIWINEVACNQDRVIVFKGPRARQILWALLALDYVCNWKWSRPLSGFWWIMTKYMYI